MKIKKYLLGLNVLVLMNALSASEQGSCASSQLEETNGASQELWELLQEYAAPSVVDEGCISTTPESFLSEESYLSDYQALPVMLQRPFLGSISTEQPGVKTLEVLQQQAVVAITQKKVELKQQEIKLQNNIRSEQIECSICGKKMQIQSLKRHQIQHLDAETKKEFDKKTRVFCDVLGCGKSFANLGNLNQHKKTHEEKTFKCTWTDSETGAVCTQMFYRNASLKAHMNRHTNTYVAKCPICDRGFYKKDLCERHVQKCGI